MIIRTLAAAALFASLSPGVAVRAQTAPAAATTVSFKDAGGKAVGQAMLRPAPSGVLLRLEVRGLSPGWHGLHFHAMGDCSDPKFERAGAHVNAAEKRPHGLLNAAGPDYGDLPNLYVGADGTGRAELFSTLVSLDGAGGKPSLKDADGSALMIHANADDHATQPIGGAGARVACAVIR